MEFTNIPAFPLQYDPYIDHPSHGRIHRNAIGEEVQQGMSLFDYHVAHAPASPPDWWEPEMEPHPSYPPNINAYFSNEQELKWLQSYDNEDGVWYDSPDDIEQFNIEPPNIPENFKERVLKVRQEIEKRRQDIFDWKVKNKYERLIQWPYWYATQIMLRRSSYIKQS